MDYSTAIADAQEVLGVSQVGSACPFLLTDNGGCDGRVAVDPQGTGGHPWCTPPVLHAKHPLDLAGVAGREVRLPTEPALALTRLVLEEMGAKRLATA